MQDLWCALECKRSFDHPLASFIWKERRDRESLYSVRQVAAQLGLAATTVYSMCRQRQIMHVRIGTGRGAIRISADALATYLSQATVQPGTPNDPNEAPLSSPRR